MLVDYEARSGAGDRYIPSRALSNFNFDLSTGTGAGGGRQHLISGGNYIGGSVVDDIVSDIRPASSFGATMMGGGVVLRVIILSLQ